MESKAPVDFSKLVDERPISALQVAIIVLCGAINFLDGMDSQSIGVAAPLIAASIGIKIGAFGPIFAAGQLGAAIGAMSFGTIGDRLGRKNVLAAATFLFGVGTLVTAVAPSFSTIVGARFCAGLGLGGAIPCFIALVSEYTPTRMRNTCVAVLWSFYPLGGMAGGIINSWLLHAFGWPAVFYLGGTLPLLVGALLLLIAPESVRYLLARNLDDDKARRTAARLFPDAIDRDARFVHHRQNVVAGSIRELFAENYRLTTLLLWTPLFLGFGTLSVTILWMPTLLNMNGISPSTTSLVIAAVGLGGFVGNGSAGHLLDRFGVAAVPIPAMALGALVVAGFGYFADNALLAGVCGFLTNVFLGIGLTACIALASAAYPTAIRSTGVGCAMSSGRFGQVFLPLITSLTISWNWTPTQMMLLIAIAPLLAAVAMYFLPARSGEEAGQPEPAADPDAVR